jgi:hypothetical protein
MKLFRLLTIVIALSGFSLGMQSLQAQPNLDNMFLEADTDSFDPGLPIGAQFPAMRALSGGQEINNVEDFFEDKGLVVFAVRSVDW